MLPLLILQLLTHTTTSQEICCCPDLNVDLRCSEGETSQLETNGFRCVATAGSTVTLECNVADINHPAIQSKKYHYYKTYELQSYKPVAYQDNFILLDCDTAQPTCQLGNVAWLNETFSTEKFATFDNFLYQCLVEVTLVDGNSFNLSSNTMWLDVLYNIQVPEEEVELTTKNPLNTNNPYERLLCELPSTNPPTKATWFYKSSAQVDTWTELDIPGHPRFALVEEDIADESSGSFTVGTLVIMIFNQTADTGIYLCNATYTASLGSNTSYTVAKYSVTGDGQEYSGTPEVKMISSIRSADYTTQNETVDFTCYARDTDARDEGLYRWVYENPDTVNYEYVNTSSSDFEGIEILNNDRTLRLPSQYQFYDMKFKCNVTRSGVTKLSTEFKQPVIVPQTLYPPSNFKKCISKEDDMELLSNQQYMMSEKVDVSPYIQKLPGASHRWFINGKQATAFSNTGGAQNETYIKMTDSTYQTSFNGAASHKCVYFSFIQTHTNEYQMIEALKLTRPANGCYGDLSDSVCESALTVTCDNTGSDPVLKVVLDRGTSQCVSVTVEKNGVSLASKSFQQVATSCSTRELELTFNKTETGEDAIDGNYTVSLAQEGTTGCSTNISIDNSKNYGGTDEGDEGDTNQTYSCAGTYSDDANSSPWLVNASQTCGITLNRLKQFGISPDSENCYELEVKEINSLGESIVKTICSGETSLANLTHEKTYTLKYSWSVLEERYNCSHVIQIRCSSSNSGTSNIAISLHLLVILISALLFRES